MIYEEIPMEEPYRKQLRSAYQSPYRRNVTMLIIMYLLFSIGIPASTKGFDEPFLFLFFQVIFLPFYYIVFQKLKQYKRYYLLDAEYGFVIKQSATITKVFPTPAGINIYWLDSDHIKTFTPNPYRHFYEGDQVIIYYLKYSKEYLDYER